MGTFAHKGTLAPLDFSRFVISTMSHIPPAPCVGAIYATSTVANQTHLNPPQSGSLFFGGAHQPLEAILSTPSRR